MTAPRLVANLGAEEGETLDAAAEPARRRAARLWSLLFAGPAPDDWPAALGPTPDGAAFPWLDGLAEAAWLDTGEATLRVHDKAFAWRAALDLGLVPACLCECVCVLEPEELRDGEAARRAVEARVRGWPAWTRGAEGRFVLKPRLGCSGRGRLTGWVPGGGRAPSDAALERLAARGGALLEPWLERTQDLAAQLRIDAEGTLHLLGTLELDVTAAGVYRGHRGLVDSRRRVASGSPYDGALRDAAAGIGAAAAAAGHRGPAGLDAFAFRGPDGQTVFRPVVEWNARFTMGTVALGLLRRALDGGAIRRPRPGVLARFVFALDPSAGGGADGGTDGPAPGVRTLPLGSASDPGTDGPRLVYAREAAAPTGGASGRTRPSSMR